MKKTTRNDDKSNRNYRRRGNKNAGNKYKDKAFADQNKSTDAAKDCDAAAVISRTNDITFYNRNPQLIKDAARIPFGNQLGRPIALGTDYTTTGLPGVCALRMIPTIGLAKTASDAVNIAASQLFTFVRKNLSTVASYAPADVLMYVAGIDNIFAMYGHISRIFGIVNNYAAENLYYPDGLLYACGFSGAALKDLKNHISDYRIRFNNLVYKAASLYLPVDFGIVKRHMWLFSNYFLDQMSSKAQTYIHVPYGYYQLNETLSDNGTALEFVKLPAQFTAFSQLLDNFDAQIEAYRNSDSMLKIAADMRRAYENHNPWTLSYIPEDFRILPIADKTVLTQVMNTDVLMNKVVTVPTANWNVIQSVDHNIVTFDPSFQATFADMGLTASGAQQIVNITDAWERGGKVLNYYDAEVSEDTIVESTRGVVTFKVTQSDTAIFWKYTSIPADVCVGADIILLDISDNSSTYAQLPINQFSMLFPHSNDQFIWMAYIHMFDWYPTLYTPMGSDGLLVPFVQLDNYTAVAQYALARLNENIMLSMWQVPEFNVPTAR